MTVPLLAPRLTGGFSRLWSIASLGLCILGETTTVYALANDAVVWASEDQWVCTVGEVAPGLWNPTVPADDKVFAERAGNGITMAASGELTSLAHKKGRKLYTQGGKHCS
ncbi:hypothetical protein [Novosphingobium album (ex Liu et al. 2023)]|uniref:Uncharacterized protein n=1 Tax=Novosphingobium album (ex Liu et al. 2023) TaxID=3031130 RepID=A0ABT5WQE2_9SPHN|nr:hypothetical protein [Novosphingobium album (ex Liu et al. 2023)]MDE8652254.1 hypothetical protein [Novosphingobium album (ex Liu et al. 2023)]